MTNHNTKAMKKIKQLLITSAVIAAVSCSKGNVSSDEVTDPGVQNTTEAFATFTISEPASMHSLSKSTRSRITDPGIAGETAVKTLHVFIYDAVSPHTASVANFSTADNTLQATANGWKTSTPIKTLQADKYIFAGINLTPAIVNEIMAKGFGAFSYKEFDQSVNDLANATNGFVMFNSTYPAITPGNDLPTSKEAAAANPISIPVARVTAKAAVFKGQNFVVYGGGTMQNIVYGWRNINKRFYFIQKMEEGMIKDYNWDSYDISDFARGTDTISVNSYQATPSVFSYTLENSFNYVPLVSTVDQATFLSIRGQFRPDEIVQVKNGGTNPQNSGDFEIVSNPNGYGTFYVVRTDDGISNYFIQGTTAEQYATLCMNNASGMPALSGNYLLKDNTYNNGLCYFHVLANSNATGQYTPYGIYRNQYYRVTLNSILAPGNPDDNFDQGQVISPNTWVNVEITIDDWEVIDENLDL